MTRTQNERVLQALRDAGDRGVCSFAPFSWDPPITRVAARVVELKALGHAIDSKPCREHGHGHHGRQTAVVYRLLTRAGLLVR